MGTFAGSAHEFLDEVIQGLGYSEGVLLNAVQIPLPGTEEEKLWVDIGDWLATAQKVNAEKIFFVKNEPVIVFSSCEHPLSDNEILDRLRRVWCMARPQRLFLSFPGELRIYDLKEAPLDKQGKSVEPLISTAHDIAEVLELLQGYRREQLEAGFLPENERLFGEPSERADHRLIHDLRELRKALREKDDLEIQYAHALIGRSIFIRYLEDRGILTEAYFGQITEKHPEWSELLERDLEKPQIKAIIQEEELKKRRYCNVLLNKDFTYALFDKLAEDFNGDLFPQDVAEKDAVSDEHLDLLRRFLLGDIQTQVNLFFWVYDFEIVPIELISSIYEEFYHDIDNGNDTGTHYTPSVLVEFMLSQILTEERLATTPKILDPACGSGIFLVEAFRRIVRYQIKEKGEALSALELREILRTQISGIEINAGAIYVSAFSLYLALLHYQKPPDILSQIEFPQEHTKPLPHLISIENHLHDQNYYHILFNVNAFALTENERIQLNQEIEAHPRRTRLKRFYENSGNLIIELHSFDVILGNPPWGFVKRTKASPEILKAQNHAQEWCQRFGWSVGDKELSQAFIARSLSLLKAGGECGFLVSTGVLFKRHPNSQKFRQRWLTESVIQTVVNFSHVREIYFNGAISPFIFVKYQASQTNAKHKIQYWSARRTRIVENSQSVVLSRSDVKTVNQSDLEQNEHLWKTYWWGGHRDASLIDAINLERPLDIFIDKDEKGESIAGRGFEGDFATGDHNPSDWLKRDYKELSVELFRRYGPISEEELKPVPELVHRFGEPAIYSGWRILVKRGITQKNNIHGRIESRLDEKSYCFRNSVHGVKVDMLEGWQRNVLIGILWSSLAKYYFFMTTGSWGAWHHEIHLSTLKKFPVLFPDDRLLRQNILEIVEKLRNEESRSYQTSPRRLLIESEATDQLNSLERDLDTLIFDLYGLSEPERDLIWDMCETELEFFYRHSQSHAVQPVEISSQTQGTIRDLPQQRDSERGLDGYLYAFLDMWNDELEPDGEFRWQIICPPRSPMLAVVLTTQYKGSVLPEPMPPNKAWANVLERLGKATHLKISRDIYLDGMIRKASDTEVFIIKRNERRLWTRSIAREDAEATLLQAIQLQKLHRNN